MAELAMASGVYDGQAFETIRYPADEIMMRVVDKGDVQIVEYRSEDRPGPPAHYHPWHEVEYVIEGQVEFQIGGQWIAGGPGTVQMLPAGQPHSVRVREGSARLLMVVIGAPYDAFAREMAGLYQREGVSLEDLVAAAARHGVGLTANTTE